MNVFDWLLICAVCFVVGVLVGLEPEYQRVKEQWRAEIERKRESRGMKP